MTAAMTPATDRPAPAPTTHARRSCPACGIALGAVLAAPMWAAIIWAVHLIITH